MSILRRSLAVAGALAVIAGVAATSAHAVDRIDVQPGPNASVSNMSNPDANGNRYVVGRFTAFNAWGTGSGGVVDGTTAQVDRTFPRVNGEVYEVVPDGSGGWWVGGDFWCVGGDAAGDGDCTDADEFVRQDLVHLNADGSVDTGFANTGLEGNVQGIAVAGGVVFVGGQINGVNQGGSLQTRTNLAAFDATGAVTTWNPGASGSAHDGPEVEDLEVSGSNIVVTGDFTTVAGASRKGVALVQQSDGTIVSGFDAGLNDEGWDAVVANGKIYVSGRFTRMNTSANRFMFGAVDATTGAVDANFLPGVDNSVHALAVDGSGNIWATGSFSTAGTSTYDGNTNSMSGSVTRQQVAQFNGTTGAPTSWAPGANAEGVTAGWPAKIAVSGGSVYLTGSFAMMDGEIRSRAAGFNATTGSLLSWDPNLGGEHSYAIAANAGKVYIGGGFSAIGGTERRGIAAFNQVTGALTPFAPALDNAAHGVGVIGDTVFVSGEFTRAKGVGGVITTREKVAAFDVNTGELESWNPSTGANTWNMAVDPTRETVFIGGDFSLGPPPGGGDARFGIAAVKGTDACVESWTTACVRNWNPSIGTSGGSLSVNGDFLYFAGHFDAVSGDTDHRRIAKVKITEACLETFTAGACVDAAWKPWIIGRGDINSGSPDRCCIATINARNDRVYIGGFFEWLENPQSPSDRQVRTYAAALDPTTGALQSWNPNVGGVVKGIAVTYGNVYFSGSFSQIDGQTRRLLGAVSEATGDLQPWDPNAVGTEIYSLIAANNTLYAGGLFTSVNGQATFNFARVAPTTLTLGVSGTGSGTVQSAGVGISCGASTCANQVAPGSDITLTAVPDAGSEFEAWTGACSGEAQPVCSVSMSEARTVTAVFRNVTPVSPPAGEGDAGSGTAAPAQMQSAGRTGVLMPVLQRAQRLQVRDRPVTAFTRRFLIRTDGLYSFYVESPTGARVPLLRSSTIGERVLRKGFYALRRSGSAGTPVVLTIKLARPLPPGAVLRIIHRASDGALTGASYRM